MKNINNHHLKHDIISLIEKEYFFRADNTKLIVIRICNGLKSFSSKDILGYIEVLNKKSIGTINTEKSYMMSIANKSKHLLPEDSYQIIKNYAKNKIKQNHRVIDLPSKEECRDFYRWLYNKNHDRKTALIFKTVLESGLRISEVKHINLKKSYVDGDFLFLNYLSLKNKKEDYVSVNSYLCNEIQSFGLLPFADIDLTSFSNKLKRRIKKYNKETVSSFPLISIHKIRHLHATILLKTGVNLSLVSKRLGHSTPAITSKFYDDTTLTKEQLSVLTL